MNPLLQLLGRGALPHASQSMARFAPGLKTVAGGGFPLGVLMNPGQGGVLEPDSDDALLGGGLQHRGAVNARKDELMRELVDLGYAEETVNWLGQSSFDITNREKAIKYIQGVQDGESPDSFRFDENPREIRDIRPFPDGPLGKNPVVSVPSGRNWAEEGGLGDPTKTAEQPPVKSGGLGWKKLLAIAGGTGLAAAVGGKDFRRGLAGGLTQLGPNMIRAKEQSDAMEFRRDQLSQQKEYQTQMLELQRSKIAATTISALRKASFDSQSAVAKHLAKIEEKIISGEFTPKDGVGSVKTFVNALPGVTWDAEMADKYKSHFTPHALAVDHFIGPTQSADMASAIGLQHQAAAIKLRLNNEEVQKHLGLVQQKMAEVNLWVSSGEGSDLFGKTPPPEFVSLMQSLGFAMDEIRRMQTGAAANKAEDSFYAGLTGSIGQGAQSINNKMDGLIANMQTHRDSPLRQALMMKYEGVLPQGMESEFPRFSMDNWTASQIELARNGDEQALKMLIDTGLIPAE